MSLNEHLTLERPLTVFDLESTGPDPDLDRIVQISITMFYPEKPSIAWKSFINPGIPIPPESFEVHKISSDMVVEAPKFADIALELVKKTMVGVDYCGYNVHFDLKLLRAECKRAGVRWDFEDTDGRVIDPLRIYQTKHPRDLSAAYKEYVDAAGFDGAHDAEADVGATIAVLIGQLKRHEDLPRTVAELADFCFPARKGFADKTGKFSIRDGVHYFAFGKFKGQLATLQRGYLEWMMKGDFPKDAKEICAGLLGGRLK